MVEELFEAVSKGDFERVKYLVEHGADVNSKRYEDGPSVLREALDYRRLDIVKYLVERGAIDSSCLGITFTWANWDLAKYFVEHGADVNYKEKGISGWSVLRYAAESLEKVKYLVEHGAKINTPMGDDGMTGFLDVCANGNLETVKYLAEECGANVKARDAKGRTALMCVYDNPKVAWYLIEIQGLDVHARDMSGKTALNHAKENAKEDRYVIKLAEFLTKYESQTTDETRKFLEEKWENIKDNYLQSIKDSLESLDLTSRRNANTNTNNRYENFPATNQSQVDTTEISRKLSSIESILRTIEDYLIMWFNR